jgi:hypothetical protein
MKAVSRMRRTESYHEGGTRCLAAPFQNKNDISNNSHVHNQSVETDKAEKNDHVDHTNHEFKPLEDMQDIKFENVSHFFLVKSVYLQ